MSFLNLSCQLINKKQGYLEDTMPNIDFNQKIICKRLYPHDKDRMMKDEDSIILFFKSDRGRIINPASIRRLQQKT